MTDTGRKRPWLAVLLALVYPGLGHLYLRLWFRSLMWFGLMASSIVVLLPEAAVQQGDTGFTAAFVAVRDGVAALPLESQLLLTSLTILQIVDAYVLARRSGESGETGPECPSCGKELDEDIDFCHWCTTRLEESAADDEGAI